MDNLILRLALIAGIGAFGWALLLRPVPEPPPRRSSMSWENTQERIRETTEQILEVPESLNGWARVSANLGQARDQRAALEWWLEIAPETLLTDHAGEGIVRFYMGRNESAAGDREWKTEALSTGAEILQRHIQSKPDRADFRHWLLLGRARFYLEQDEAAMYALRRADEALRRDTRRVSPDQQQQATLNWRLMARVWGTFGEMLLTSEDFDAARAAWRAAADALAIGGEHANGRGATWWNVGWGLRHAGLEDAAQEAWRRAEQRQLRVIAEVEGRPVPDPANPPDLAPGGPADEALDAASSSDQRPDPSLYYNLACYRSLLGKHDAALVALRRAAELGYGNVEHIRADSDLLPLHDEPEFAAIIEFIEKRNERRRAEEAAKRREFGDGLPRLRRPD